jgi:uroporphyrinogen decarboxylase
VLEEDERTKIYVNHEGIIMRELKVHSSSSMPQFLKFPVENESDFDKLCRERFGLNFEKRTPADWDQKVESWKSRTGPLMCFADRWGGFFGPLRNLMGLEGLSLAFYDQPKLVEKMMDQRVQAIIEITDRILECADIDAFAFWEDMAYKTGPLLSPDMFSRFMVPRYRKVCEWLRSRGVDFIFVDSDGNVEELIPLWLEAGLTGVWPFEVAAGMDVCELRRRYGHDLVMMGGIDKRAIATGGQTMRQEVDRVIPAVEDGGYIPGLDHGAPPDISWKNVCEYMEYLLYRLGR